MPNNPINELTSLSLYDMTVDLIDAAVILVVPEQDEDYTDSAIDPGLIFIYAVLLLGFFFLMGCLSKCRNDELKTHKDGLVGVAQSIGFGDQNDNQIQALNQGRLEQIKV